MTRLGDIIWGLPMTVPDIKSALNEVVDGCRGGCLPKPAGAPGIEVRTWLIEIRVPTGTTSKLALRP